MPVLLLSDRINQFNQHLSISVRLPKDIEILNPFKDPVTSYLSQRFYKKYYNDTKMRTMILGINPGRFGSGLTGVPFTDPINLEKYCSIENKLPKKQEISSEFIYAMIDSFGGCDRFYQNFYFSSISPLGFVKEGKNLNYYDVKGLSEKLRDFILSNLSEQLSWGINREVVFCLGEGKNFAFLEELNSKHRFFTRVIPLPHPRFI
ncbi:MAG: DUF4918 family protein, partial [Cyclobacteriaceae bacterium]|nr:DUF4918 family protein [Cyclobacteriaceae bacterium]